MAWALGSVSWLGLLLLRGQKGRQSLDCECIAANAEAAKAGFGDCGDVGAMPEALAREDIADVDFDDRQPTAAMASRSASDVWV